MSSTYDRLYSALKKRYLRELSKTAVQDKCNEIWTQLKNVHKDMETLRKATENLIVDINQESTRKSTSLLNYFVQVGKNVTTERNIDGNVENDSLNLKQERSLQKSPAKEPQKTVNNNLLPSQSKFPTPRQDNLLNEIRVKETELNYLVTKRDAGFAENTVEKNIVKLRKDLSKAKKDLKEKQLRAEKQKEYRKKQRENIQNLHREFPEAAEMLQTRKDVGRPRLETDQSGLLTAICDLVLHSGSAEDKRRSEAIRACETLDKLHAELKLMGYTLCRTSVYLRLLPRNSATVEGKRHVTTVPVKLCRAQADQHKDHIDQYFCKATIEGLEEIASILGPRQVCIISQDDKAKVPLGKTAAKAQAPILMHLEYKVRLPDHDWVVGRRHKLIPSVYAGIEIKDYCLGKKEAVTHSGPTYIAIRSGKHSSSTADSHAQDLEKLFEIDEFQSIVKRDDGWIKPVLMLSVDGGPDENPRYKKNILHGVNIFKKHNLDALFIFTNAPGRSAFNRVERRMAPLSRALSGVILTHEKYGSHLDANGETIDLELELRNFQHAGETLAEIWSQLRIDGFDVVAKFIPSDQIAPEAPTIMDHQWYSGHVRESQYFLQIVKCDDLSCCSSMRSNLRQILYQRFMPAPFPLNQSTFSIPTTSSDFKTHKYPSFLLRQALTLRPNYPKTREIPYDLYCPSVQSKINERICPSCGIYFASQDSMKNRHKKNVHSRQKKTDCMTSRIRPLQVFGQRPGEILCSISEDTLEWVDVDLIDERDHINLAENSTSSMPLIKDMSSWILQGIPFVEQ